MNSSETNGTNILDEDTSQGLENSSPLIKFEPWKDEASGNVYMTTNLRYAEHWRTFWGKPTGKYGKYERYAYS